MGYCLGNLQVPDRGRKTALRIPHFLFAYFKVKLGGGPKKVYGFYVVEINQHFLLYTLK